MVIGIVISSFSQTSYPKKILWGSDTLVAITKPQLIKVNKAINGYIHLKRANINLQMDLVVLDSLCNYWKGVSEKYESLFLTESHKCKSAESITASFQEILHDEKNKSRKIGIGVGVGGTLLSILLGVLLIK